MFDEQHNGCQLITEVMEGGNPHTWACVIMNDMRDPFARDREEPTSTERCSQQLLSYNHVDALKGN